MQEKYLRIGRVIFMQESNKNTTIQRLRTRYRMDRVLGCREMVILRGQSTLTVYGCKKILHYSPERICLQLTGKELLIMGESIYCTCFSHGSVTVEGKINAISYSTFEAGISG